MILLADTNILFDFAWVDGLKELCSLGPLEILENVLDEVTVDTELAEIASTLLGHGAQIIAVDSGWLPGIRPLKRGGLSLTDATVLYYAREHTRTVLTSERKLRERCQQAEVDVHGSLWVVSELKRQSLCERARLCAWLAQWPKHGARLPEAKVQELQRELGCAAPL